MFRSLVFRSRRAERGQALVLAALLLTSLLGVAGLTIDLGLSYVQYREAQAAADAAAIAAADNMPGGATAPTSTQLAQAQADASAVAATSNAPANGFSNGVNNTTVTITAPYTGGPSACASNPYSCAQVTITRQVPTHFLPIFGKSTITVSRSAVAMAQVSSSASAPCQLCILSLDSSGNAQNRAGALTNKGNGGVNTSNAVVQINSTSSTALQLGGNGAMNVGGTGRAIDIVGNWCTCGTSNPTPTTGVAVVPDPLASVPYPSLSGYINCPDVSFSNNNSATMSAGCYHNVTVGGNYGTLTLSSGIYVITGKFDMSGNMNVDATSGVMFFFTCGGSTPSLCSAAGSPDGYSTTVSCSSYNHSSHTGGYFIQESGTNGSLNVYPPSSGAYQGLAVFYDRNDAQDMTFLGAGSGNHFRGGIYLRTARLCDNANGGPVDLNTLLVVQQLYMDSNSGGITDNFVAANNPSGGGAARSASKLVQ